MAIPIAYNLRNLRVRKAATLMTAGGIALGIDRFQPADGGDDRRCNA